MDIRPAGSSVPPTSALDALKRVQSSAAADDSEDSQTAAYLFGDSGQQPGKQGEEEDDPQEPIADAVEINAELLAAQERRPIASSAQDADVADNTQPAPATESERHIDIEA